MPLVMIIYTRYHKKLVRKEWDAIYKVLAFTNVGPFSIMT